MKDIELTNMSIEEIKEMLNLIKQRRCNNAILESAAFISARLLFLYLIEEGMGIEEAGNLLYDLYHESKDSLASIAAKYMGRKVSLGDPTLESKMLPTPVAKTELLSPKLLI